ncbi:MAG: serine/threonine protein kinase, partial [Candidatus Competibacteraceae bacterium]|nr:serine/threonine protein kinase [Candidatus Competibacteraceae bacterium]
MNADVIADKYEVLAELGRGGMGRVYKARHRGLNKVYALKMLHEHLADDASLIERFHNEARIMASLHHAHIIQVFDIDRDADRHYFVMEYIEGQTLSDVLKHRAPLPLAEVIRISSQISQALDYAHRQEPPIIHRDIKPSNIMLEAGTDRVVVTDFGIAKLLDTESTRHTLTGFTVGTPSYAAPEQLRSTSDLDGRADIFPLGLVMYEMLAGRALFENMTPEEIIGQKLFDPRELTPAFDTSVPTGLQQIIRRAIAKNREQRYPSVAALLDDLQQLGAGTLSTATSPTQSP